MSEQKQAFEQWAIVEIFGHQRIAGKVTEQTIGGCSFVRVDVPELPERIVDDYGRKRTLPAISGFTKLYGNAAIYAMSFVDEAIAKATAGSLRVLPIDSYTLSDALRSANPEKVRQLSAPEEEGDDPDDDIPFDRERAA